MRPLVEQARSGDEEAFARLASALGDGLLAIAFRILRDLPSAEDAVQQSLVTAWRELPRLRDPDRFEAWLHRILVHACYRELRDRPHRVPVHVLSIATSPASDGYVVVDERDELERAFQRLSPEQRTVVVFHHYLGLTIGEVAERLDLPIGTVKSRIHYATEGLRAALEADARPAIDAAWER